jgi:hypothetical protein
VNSEFLGSAFTAAGAFQEVVPLMHVGAYALAKSGIYCEDDAGPLPASVPPWLPQGESGRAPRTPTAAAPTAR